MFKTFVCLYDLLREKLNCCCDRKIKSSFLSVKLRCIKSIWTINIRFFVSCWSQFIFPDRYKWVQKRLHVFMSNWFHGFHHISMYLTPLYCNIRYYMNIDDKNIKHLFINYMCIYKYLDENIHISDILYRHNTMPFDLAFFVLLIVWNDIRCLWQRDFNDM